MRVIAGSARRIQLKTVEGNDTRPTTDRIKETLFNMIHPNLYDAVFLDLFSGSGGIGIEALSRGAKYACFVENNRAAISCINSNLNATNLIDRADIYSNDVLLALKMMESKNKVFDIIFMDPPYDNEYEKDVLNYLKDSSIIHDESIIVVEASINTEFDYLNNNFEVYKTKEYKTNKHIFIHRKTRKESE